jgi:citronellol/citronellal dehydrogenase
VGGLAGKTVFISGGSRGIGLAIGLRAAADGANVALLAKTSSPDPRLSGTIHTAAAAVEQAGGQSLALVGDVRDETAVVRAVAAVVERFGGIDVVVNNASAIALDGSEQLSMSRFDLMQQINVRGTFLVSRTCVEHLRRSDNPHVLTLSPPITLDPSWLAAHLGYTISKYGMTLCTLGLARELAADGIACNSLWPRTFIATDAVRNVMGIREASYRRARSPQIMADAAHAIVTRDSRRTTGTCFIDDAVLAEEGVTDLSPYQDGDGSELITDLFIEGAPHA